VLFGQEYFDFKDGGFSLKMFIKNTRQTPTTPRHHLIFPLSFARVFFGVSRAYWWWKMTRDTAAATHFRQLVSVCVGRGVC